MKQFNGFPLKMEFTSIPNPFFSALLPEIDDLAELRTTLHIMAVLYRKRGHPRFVTYGELLGNASLVNGLKKEDKPVEESLQEALKKAAQRGTVIHLTLDNEGTSEDIYFLNTEPNRQIVARVQSGELKLGGLTGKRTIDVVTEELPDIFTLYEQNIGVLTPMIAEELREAEKTYPEDWIREAVKESVSLNKRNWRYIARILENWSIEGKSVGAHQRDSKADPDRYIKGKYGHMVRR